LEKFEAIRPDYHMMSPQLPAMLEQSEAALLIGDHAIHAKWNQSTNYIYDLGDLWYKHTGMWMTFALWCVRKNAIAYQSSLLKDVHEEFLRSKQQGSEQIDEIIDFIIEQHGGTRDFWQQYFSGLCHDFDSNQKQGLNYYFKCAAEMGLITHPMTV